MWTYPTPEGLAAYHEDRVAQLRREIHGGRGRTRRVHPARRWVGRQLVRAGALVAADPSLRPARSL